MLFQNFNLDLHNAAERGDVDKVKALLEGGMAPNTRNVLGETPLHKVRDHNAVAAALVAAGGDVNAQDQDGDTPLHRAATGGHKTVGEFLLGKGAEVNISGFRGLTPLHLAALNHDGNPLAQILLEGGARASARDDEGKTALDRAIDKGHNQTVEVLKNAKRSFFQRLFGG